MAGIINSRTRMLRGLSHLSPMQQFDKWLLAARPIIWRTSILHVLWWSLLGYCALCAPAALIQVSPTDIPTLATLDFYALFIWVPIVFAMAYWMFSLWRISPPRVDWRTFLTTLLLYFVCLYAAGAIPTGLNHILSRKIAATQPDSAFASDYDTMAKYAFGLCFEANDDQARKATAAISPKYGLNSSFDDSSSCGSFGTECSSQSCATFSNKNNIPVAGTGLSDRMHVVKWSKDFADGGSNEISSRSSFLDRNRAILFLLLSLLMATCHLSNSAYNPADSERRFSWRKLIPNPKRITPNGIIRWDRKLLVGNPYFWSTGIHIVFIYNFLVQIISISMIVLLFVIFAYTIDTAYISYIFVYALLFFIPPILIITLFKLDRHFEFNNPSNHVLYLVSSFFSSSLGIFVLFLIAIYVYNAIDMELGTAVAALGILLAHGIYMASNFSYASKVWDVKLATFGALFSILLYFSVIASVVVFFSGGMTYLIVFSILIIPALSFIIFYVPRKFMNGSASIYLLMFAIFSTPSISLLIFILIFLAFIASSIYNYFDFSFGALVSLAVLLVAFLPILLTVSLYRPVFRAIHRIYMAPVDS